MYLTLLSNDRTHDMLNLVQGAFEEQSICRHFNKVILE